MWNDVFASGIVSMDTSSVDMWIQYEKSYFSKNRLMIRYYLVSLIYLTMIHW